MAAKLRPPSVPNHGFGRHLIWEITSMTDHSPTRRVVLSLLAHPDDAEILCAGTLIRLSDLGWDVHIATATAGDCGSVDLPADQIAQLRRAEATAAAELIGATYHCLGLRDVDVIFDHQSNRLAIDLFRRIAPTLVITHPRCDYMLDHEQVHLLARSAAFSYPIPNASALPMAEGAAIPWLYYCDPVEGHDPYRGTAITPSVYVDITTAIDRKIEMLSCHQSQRQWLRSHHGMDEYLESMKRHGAQRGQELGSEYAEAFVQHRGHAFPQSHLLQEILGGI
jgi:LmbE family N-acetylglucosaminyl deacetylase